MTSPETRPNSDKDSSNATARVRSVPHPRYTLAQVEDLARQVFNIGARHCDQDAVAQAVHYKNSTNGAFKGIRAAASYFGLVTYGDDRYLSVTEPWIETFHADDDDGIRRLRREAVQQPELYRQLIEEFSDRQLPNTEKLARQLFLATKYGILKDAADTAARVFLDSVRFAGLVDANNFLRVNDVSDVGSVPASPSDQSQHQRPTSPQDSGTQPQPNTIQNPGIIFPVNEHLDRIEVQLTGGRRAYLFVPVPLPAREKDRLKKYIDLILEPDEASSSLDK